MEVKNTNLFGGKKAEPGTQPTGSNTTQKAGELKTVHIVEMKDDKAGARHDVNLAPGTKVSDVKAQLKYTLKDSLIRAKNRQVLPNDVSIYELAEPDEKFVLMPNTEVGLSLGV